MDSDGKIQRYKARLVAQGFSQQRGIDYNETYSPVVNFSLIRLLLALIVQHHWYTKHIDIKCAYMYGKLQEEIFMRLPPLYKAEDGTVAKLLRPIYGRSNRKEGNEELNRFLIDLGCKRMKSSSCVYVEGLDGNTDLCR